MTLGRDIETLARTLWGECRGETIVGQRAVAQVIINRSKDPRWPDSIADVCLQPWQFSAWNENDPNREKLEKVGLNDIAFVDCLHVAIDAMSGSPDLVKGANHYLTSALAKSRPPKWFDPAKVTKTIGSHVFLKL